MLINSVEIVVKKSRFIGLLYEVHSIDEVKEILEGLKKEHKNLERKNMDNCLIVVIRYFGGIKLGAGGLIRAYGATANEVTKNY